MDPQMVWDMMDEYEAEQPQAATSACASPEVTAEKDQLNEAVRKSKSSWMGFPRYCAE